MELVSLLIVKPLPWKCRPQAWFDMHFLSIDRGGLGRDIREARTHLGLSLSDAADRSGVSASNLWKIESGQSSPALDTLISIAVAMGLPIGRLIFDHIELDTAELDAAIRRDVASAFAEKSAPEQETATEWARGSVRAISLGILTESPDLLLRMQFPSPRHRWILAQAVYNFLFGATISDRARFLDGIGKSPLATLIQLGVWNSGIEAHTSWMAEAASSGNQVPKWEPCRKSVIDDLKSPGVSLSKTIFAAGFLAHLSISPGASLPPTPIGPEASAAKSEGGIPLPNITDFGNTIPVPQDLEEFLREMRDATRERGQKTELAVYLGVPLANVSQWLSGTREPSGATVLRMLNWVSSRNRKKGPSGARTPNGPETRSKKSSHEKPRPRP